MSSASHAVPPRPDRSIVTEEALFVSPEVLGLPLAGPWRRATAMAVDGILVALLTNTPSVLLGLTAAYVLFRVSGRRKPGGGYIRRSFRFMMRVGGAVMLFVVAVSMWDSVRARFRGGVEAGERDGAVSTTVSVGEGTELNLSAMEAVQFGAQVVALHSADSEPQARAAAEALLRRVRSAGGSAEEARQTVRGLVQEDEARPWIARAVDGVLAEDAAAEQEAEATPVAAPDAAAEPDALLAAYAAAVAAEDTVTADSLRPEVVALLSADTVGALAGSITSLEEDREALREEISELEEEIEEGPGVMATLRAFANDLGLGLGWFGLYFTATTAMWQGRTPGKRLLRIRVISLTGKPIGWWAAFERFGGYAAGFATGLLGFLQILWDDNRQAIHDKIAVTAVIRDSAGRKSP